MIDKFQHLKKAPIIEAVFEIKTIPATSWEEAERTAEIKRIYPSGYTFESETKFEQTFGLIPVQSPEAISPVVSWNGLKMISDDKTEIIRFSRDAFSFSRLRPYTNWDNFSSNSLKNYERYKTINNSAFNIKRLGIRFINSIDYEGNDLSKYLKYPPVMAGNIDMTLSGFLHHNSYSVLEEGFQINHIQMLKPAAENQKNPVLIIDVDIFLDIIKPDFNITAALSKIRNLKNDIFFGSITEEMIGRFK